jgi:hypothetical protein
MLVSPVRAWAASGTEGASFLDIPVGAEPAALGSAYTALASDAYAPVWNPAGLGFEPTPQLATQYLSYVESINYEFASFVYPLPSAQALGASIQYLGTGNIPGTEVGGVPIGDFSSHFAAYSLAYGRALSDRWSLGMTGKLVNAQISDVSANAFAVDLGGLYRLWDNTSVAATLDNLGSKLNFLSEGDSLPWAFHLAASYVPTRQWLATAEGIYPSAGPASFRLGGQWRPVQAFCLRAGYRTDTLKELSALAGFSTGFGVHIWGQELSYAWVPMSDLGDTHYVSLTFHFSQTAEKGNVLKAEEAPPPNSERESGAPPAYPRHAAPDYPETSQPRMLAPEAPR